MKKIDKQIEEILKQLRDHSKYMIGNEDQCVVCGMSWIRLADEIESLLSSQRDELIKEIEKMPINKHEVHYYIEVEGHKECIKCYAIKQMHILARRYANKP